MKNPLEPSWCASLGTAKVGLLSRRWRGLVTGTEEQGLWLIGHHFHLKQRSVWFGGRKNDWFHWRRKVSVRLLEFSKQRNHSPLGSSRLGRCAGAAHGAARTYFFRGRREQKADSPPFKNKRTSHHPKKEQNSARSLVLKKSASTCDQTEEEDNAPDIDRDSARTAPTMRCRDGNRSPGRMT